MSDSVANNGGWCLLHDSTHKVTCTANNDQYAYYQSDVCQYKSGEVRCVVFTVLLYN